MATSKEEARVLKRDDYVVIIETKDEWEDLIGKVEEFMSDDGDLHNDFRHGDRVVVFFPINREDIYLLRLVGINNFPKLAAHHLRQFQGKQVFENRSVEWFDSNEL